MFDQNGHGRGGRRRGNESLISLFSSAFPRCPCAPVVNPPLHFRFPIYDLRSDILYRVNCPSSIVNACGLTSGFKIKIPSHRAHRKSSIVNLYPSSLCNFASPKSLFVSPSPSTPLKLNKEKSMKKILIFFAVIYITYHWEIMRKPAKKCRRIVAKTRNL